MARFHVKGTFQLDGDGPRAVIYGDVVEGTIREGMSVQIPFNGSLSMAARIEAIEFLDNVSERISHVGLVLDVEELAQEEVELIQSLNIGGETLEITD